MWKKYLKKKITEATFWIGLAIIASVLFFPPIVTIVLGFYLVITPDDKLCKMIEAFAKKVKMELL